MTEDGTTQSNSSKQPDQRVNLVSVHGGRLLEFRRRTVSSGPIMTTTFFVAIDCRNPNAWSEFTQLEYPGV